MGDLYSRRVLNDPTVRLSYGDPLVPIIKPDQVELHLSNDDGYFDTLDLLGETITYSRFDKLSNETWAELSGRVTSQELLLDRIVLSCVTYDLDDFQTLLPKEVVTAATFPLAHPQQGLGKPIPVVFGNAASTNKVNDAWEMAYVGEDTGNNYYDYLVGRGTFTGITVYRNTIGDALFVVPSGEYAVNTTAYPGFTVIRFSLATSVAPRQANFGGGLHRLYVAANGLATERNFARAIQSLLSNSTWGLGLSVNTASFDTAAAALDAIGGLYCDGAMDTQRTAYDWLSQLVNVRGIRLEMNSSGEYTITVDTQASTIKGRFGHGQGQTWNGVVEGGFKGLSTTPVSDAIKSLILEYRKDRQSDQYVLATSSRSVLTVGTEERVQHDFIRDKTTADKTACYWANRYLYEKERLSFTAEQSARKIRPGELIQYHAIRPAFSKTFRVMGIERQLTTSAVKARGWDAAIYTYTAGTLPAEPAAITETDYTRQTPTAVTSLSIVASGVETDGQNAYLAKVTLQYTVPIETWAQTIVRYRRNGTTNWQSAAVNQATGANLQTQITGLITGASYDYQVSRVNAMAPSLSADASLTAQVAPADTTAPGAPTTLAIVDQHLKTITFKWVAPADKDVKNYHWEIRTSGSGGGSLVAEGDTDGPGVQVTLTLNQIAYATTRYLRILGKDFSGNTGTYSASLSFSFSQIVTGDVGNAQVGGTQIKTGASGVATENVVNNAITAYGNYSADGVIGLSTSAQSLGSLTISTSGGAGHIIGKAEIFNAGDGTPGQNTISSLELRKDSTTGTLLDYADLTTPADVPVTAALTLIGYDTSPAASQTYYLVGYRSGSGTSSASRRRIMPVNFKK